MVAPVNDPGKLGFMQKKCCDATKRFATFFNHYDEFGTNSEHQPDGCVMRCFPVVLTA